MIMVRSRAMNVAVGDLVVGGVADVDDLDGKIQLNAGERVRILNA